MKYRQRGYHEQDYEQDNHTRRRGNKQDDLGNGQQLRSLRHAIDREVTVVVRCGRCGHQVPSSMLDVNMDTVCSKCGTALHSCRHCRKFDTGSRLECREPIKVRIADKWVANGCKLFKPAQVLDATGRRAQPPEDARTAFHNLFKN